MKTIKRMLALLLVLSMMTSFLAVGASAAETKKASSKPIVTEETVETPTEEPTKGLGETKAEETAAPTDTPDEIEAPVLGCGATVGMGLLAVLAAAAFALRRRKDD